MEITKNREKQQAIDLAEDSREKEWKHKSFIAELFKGKFEWDLISPYPVQDPQDKEEGDQFLEAVESCLKKYINPDEVDRTQTVPKEALKALAEIGCFGMRIDKKYGGLDLSVVNYNRAIALIGSYCSSTAVWLSAHQSIGVPQPLKLFGTEEQRQKYLPRLAKGEISAFALTEPGVGSDPANMKTKAIPTEDGNHYIINGEKMWITNGPDADIIIVMAQTPPKMINGKEKKQITAFIVETNTPGFEVTHLCDFVGIRGISNGILQFNDLKVPRENIVGELGKGLKIALTTLNTGRLTIPAVVNGASKLCLNYCREWSNKRIQWGQPIGEHQAVANRLAEMAANTFAMDSMVWLTSNFADLGNTDFRLEAAMAKYFCTEVSWNLMDDALQIRGGRGYETAESLERRGEDSYPIERMLRDTRVNRIIEGTSEIMQLFIAREAMDFHVQYIMPIMQQNGKGVGKLLKNTLKAAGFYSIYYPKLWLNSLGAGSAPISIKYLSSENRGHLAYLDKTSKKLARTMFHTMARYQKKLEKEQILLSHFVDIGTYLFAMACVLSNTEYRLQNDSNNQSVQQLADLFCKKSIMKIDHWFDLIHHNHNKLIDTVSAHLCQGQYTWLEEGVIKV